MKFVIFLSCKPLFNMADYGCPIQSNRVLRRPNLQTSNGLHGVRVQIHLMLFKGDIPINNHIRQAGPLDSKCLLPRLERRILTISPVPRKFHHRSA